MIIFCAGNTSGSSNSMCKNESQDKMYGKQMRVHNKIDKKIGEQWMYRCTICEKEKTKR